MPTAITRSLHHLFSRLKTSSSSSSSSSSSAPLDNPNCASSLPSSPSSVIFRDFNCLYGHTVVTLSDSETSTGSVAKTSATLPITATATATATVTTDTPSPCSAACNADLSSAIASRRLLPPSSPSLSNAIADPAVIPVGIGIAVPTYSTDPYGEFRRSMEQMAVLMGLLDQNSRREREWLHELLLCYLVLNRKHAHKYIVRAFADLLLAPPESAPAAAEEPGVEEEDEISWW